MGDLRPFDLSIFQNYVSNLQKAIRDSLYSKDSSHLDNFYKNTLDPLGMDVPYFKYNKDTHVVEFDPTHKLFSEDSAYGSPGHSLVPGEYDPLSGMVQPRYRTRGDLFDVFAGKNIKELDQNFNNNNYNPLRSVKSDWEHHTSDWINSKLKPILANLFKIAPRQASQVIDRRGNMLPDADAAQAFNTAMASVRNFLHRSMTDIAEQSAKSADFLRMNGGTTDPLIVPFGRDMEYGTPYFLEAMSKYDLPLSNLVPLEINRNAVGSGQGIQAYKDYSAPFSLANPKDSSWKETVNRGIARNYYPDYTNLNDLTPEQALFKLAFPTNISNMSESPESFTRKYSEAIKNDDNYVGGAAYDINEGIFNKMSQRASSLARRGTNEPFTSFNDIFPILRDPTSKTSPVLSPNHTKLALTSIPVALSMWHALGQDPRARGIYENVPVVTADTGFNASIAAALRANEQYYRGLKNMFSMATKNDMAGLLPNFAREQMFRNPGGSLMFAHPWDTLQVYANGADWGILNRMLGEKRLNSRGFRSDPELERLYGTAALADSHGEGTPHRTGKALQVKMPNYNLNNYGITPEEIRNTVDFASPLYEDLKTTLEKIEAARKNLEPAEGQTIERKRNSPVETTLAHMIPEELRKMREDPAHVAQPFGAFGDVLAYFKGKLPADWRERLIKDSAKNGTAASLLKSINERLYMNPMDVSKIPDLARVYAENVVPQYEAPYSSYLRNLSAPLLGGVGVSGHKYKESGDWGDAALGLLEGTGVGAAAGWLMSKIPGLGGALMGQDLGAKLNEYTGNHLSPAVARALGAIGTVGGEILAPELFVPATMALGAYDAAKPWYDVYTHGVDHPKPDNTSSAPSGGTLNFLGEKLPYA